jgi:hypothetical protein
MSHRRLALSERIVGNPEVNLQCWSAIRAPRSLCAEAGTRAAAPFPAPLSPLAASFLRCAPDRFLLTKPNTLLHNRVASVATLRWCSGSSRNAVRLPSEQAFSFAGIPNRESHGEKVAAKKSTSFPPRSRFWGARTTAAKNHASGRSQDWVTINGSMSANA